MSAVGYASIPVTLSFANAAKAVQSQLKPQLDKLAKDAAAGIDKNVGSAVDAASKKVERARQREQKATEAATQAESKLKAETEKREGALKRVETATLNLEMAQRKSTDAVAKAQGEYDKLVSSGTASAEQLAAAERKIADARDKGKADVLKRETQLDNARSALTTQTQRVADAEVKMASAKDKAAGASERVLSATKQLDEAQAQAERSSKGLSGALASMGDAATDAAEKSGGLGQKLMDGFKTVGKGALLGVGAKAGTMVMDGVHTAMSKGFDRLQSIEQAEKMLEGLGHSATTVDTIMDNAMTSVKGTAYGFGEAASMAATFVGAGVKEGDELTRVLKLVGDTAAITGSDFQEMGSIWTKVASNQKLSTEEMNQLMDRGLGLLPALQEKYGVTAEEARKMVSEGKISFEDFASAMEGMVGGSAQKMGETFSGSLSNMNAALGRFGAKLLEPVFANAPAVFAAVGAAVDELGKKLEPVITQISEWLAPKMQFLAETVVPMLADAFLGVIDKLISMGEWVQRNSEWLGPLVAAIGGAVAGFAAVEGAMVAASKAVTLVTNGVKLLTLAMDVNPVVLLIGAIAGLVAGLVYFFKKTETGQRLWGQFMDSLHQAADWMVSTFGPIFEAVGDTVGRVFGTIKDTAGEVFNILFRGDFTGGGKLFGLGDESSGTVDFLFRVRDAAVTVKDGVVAAFQWMQDKWAEFSTGVGQFYETWIAPVWEAFQVATVVLSTVVAGEWQKIGDSAQSMWGVVSPIFGFFLQGWQVLSEGVAAIGSTVIEAVWLSIQAAAQAMWDVLQGVFEQIKIGFQIVGDVLQSVWENVIAPVFGLFRDGAGLTADILTGNFDNIGNRFQSMGDHLHQVVTGPISVAKDIFVALVTAMGRTMDNFKATAAQAVAGVVAKMQEMVGVLKRIPDQVRQIFANAGHWLVDSGRQMIQGFIDGISSMAGAVGRAVSSVIPHNLGGLVGFSGGGLAGFAEGGVLPDVPGVSRQVRDPILGVNSGGVPVARVEPGEFIVNREATAKHLPLLRAINSGRINPAQGDLGLPRYANGGVVSARQLLAFAGGQRVNGQQAPCSLEGIPYVWGGGLLANWGDCSGAMSGLAALAAGVSVAGRKFATGTEGQWLGSNGFTRGTSSGRNAFEIGYFNGGPYGGHTAGTIFDENGVATNVEMGGGRGNGQIGGRAAGSRHSQFTDRYFINLPAAAGGAAQVVSTSVDGVTLAAVPEKSMGSAKTYQIDWGTASQLGSKYDTDTHRDAALREYLNRRAKVYDTGGILPTGGVAVNLGKPELVFPAQATTAMLQMARQTPQFAAAMEQLSAAAPELAAAVDKFTDLDYGVIAEEMTAAWRNEDFGYGELARAIGDEAAERVVTELAFIGDQIRDMQDGSNIRAYLADLRPSEAVGLADQAGQIVGVKGINSTFGGVAKAYESLQDAAVMQVDAADAVTQSEKNLADARKQQAEMLKEAGADPELSTKTQRKLEDSERKLAEARKTGDPKKIADAERGLARTREDAQAELEKSGVKNADQLVKASEAVTAAEQDHEKALGVVQMAARATGQAQIAMALEVAEMVVKIGKQLCELANKITTWISGIRTQTRAAVWELTKSWSELAGVVDQHRGMVAQLQMQLVTAALDVIGKSMEMRTAQVDVVRAQLEGAKNVAEAEAALQGERDKVMGKQKWNFRDMSLEYDRFRQGYRDGINEQIAGMSQLSVQERDRIMATIGGVGRLSEEERARLADAVAGISDLSAEERARIVNAINGNGELTAADRARLSAAIAGMAELSSEERARMQSALTGIGSVSARERDRITAAMDGLVTLTAEERARLSASVAGMSELSERERARVMVSLNGVGQLADEERDRVRQAVRSFDDLTAGERERINAALAGVGELTAGERSRVANAIANMSDLSAEESERIIRAINGVSEVAQEERLRVAAALTGIGSIHGKQEDLTSQIIANADREGLAAQLSLDAKLAAQKAADDAYIASVNGREVGERELHQMYKLQLAEQLVGEQAFQALKDASLDKQLEWQARVDKAAQLGLEAELKARAVVTPEILALQREVYAAEFAQQKSILDAQIKGIEATFAQQQALVTMGRLQEDLVRQQAELDRLSGQTMGMNQGQAIVMEEIARLEAQNAEIMGKRNSAGAKARNALGRMFDWNGDGNRGRNTWSVERKQYDAQIAANNAQIEELKKSQYASGAFTPAQQREIDKATKLAAKYFAQGNEAAAKAALQASPLGNAQRTLEVSATNKRITDWEKQQRDLQREQQDMLAEFKKNTQVIPLQWRSQELESRESAQRYAADALRSENAGVRDALATLSRLEESNAAELKQLREKPTVVNLTVPGPRDGVTTIGEMEDALVTLADELGATRTDVKRLNEAQRTSASDRVRAAIGRY